MAVGFAARLLALGGSLVPVSVRVPTISRIIIGMMMGMAFSHLVGMLENHNSTRSQHVNKRDRDEQ